MYFLKILKGKFFMKICVFNTLDIEIFNYLKEYYFNLKCLKSVKGIVCLFLRRRE